jgi:hypothetical protein
MDIYLSPLYVIVAGLVIVFIFSKLRVPIAIIAVAAIFLVTYTIYYHVSMFSTEYTVISRSAWVQSLGSTILIGAVVLLSIGYIIFFLKKDPALTGYKNYLPAQNQQNPKQSWNPFSSVTKSITPMMSPSSVRSPAEDLSNSQRKNYISALDRLI